MAARAKKLETSLGWAADPKQRVFWCTPTLGNLVVLYQAIQPGEGVGRLPGEPLLLFASFVPVGCGKPNNEQQVVNPGCPKGCEHLGLKRQFLCWIVAWCEDGMNGGVGCL